MTKTIISSTITFLVLCSFMLFGEAYYLDYVGYVLVGVVNTILALNTITLLTSKSDKPLKFKSKFLRVQGILFYILYSVVLYHLGHKTFAYIVFANVTIFSIVVNYHINKLGVTYENV